jgi:hypothetical protein
VRKKTHIPIHRWKALTQAHITACMPERYHSHSAFPKVEMKKVSLKPHFSRPGTTLPGVDSGRSTVWTLPEVPATHGHAWRATTRPSNPTKGPRAES